MCVCWLLFSKSQHFFLLVGSGWLVKMKFSSQLGNLVRQRPIHKGHLHRKWQRLCPCRWTSTSSVFYKQSWVSRCPPQCEQFSVSVFAIRDHKRVGERDGIWCCNSTQFHVWRMSGDARIEEPVGTREWMTEADDFKGITPHVPLLLSLCASCWQILKLTLIFNFICRKKGKRSSVDI